MASDPLAGPRGSVINKRRTAARSWRSAKRRGDMYDPNIAQIQDAEKEEKARRTPNNGPRDRLFQFYEGPQGRLSKARRAEEIATATGDDGLMKDARLRTLRAEQAVARQEQALEGGNSREALIWDALMTSRIGPRIISSSGVPKPIRSPRSVISLGTWRRAISRSRRLRSP